MLTAGMAQITASKPLSRAKRVFQFIPSAMEDPDSTKENAVNKKPSLIISDPLVADFSPIGIEGCRTQKKPIDGLSCISFKQTKTSARKKPDTCIGCTLYLSGCRAGGDQEPFNTFSFGP